MTNETFKAACVQLQTGQELDENYQLAEQLIRQAAGGGAQYVQTPEQTMLMELKSKALFAGIKSEGDDPYIPRFMALAKELNIWLHLGSVAVLVGENKAANRAFVINPNGEISARYDKIHMFDVDLPNGENYRESKNYEPGQAAVVVDLPWGRLGLSICYDLRFGVLYRALAHAGSGILSVPAAFTKQTGEAHWHVLQRARAIENGCFVISAAQGGKHQNGRETFGHSLIISPWGEILAESGTEPEVIFADIDLGQVEKARAKVPPLSHDRRFGIRVGLGETIMAAE